MVQPVMFEGTEEQSKNYKVAARKWVARCPSMTVMEFALDPGEDVPLHHHSDCYDIFYCIEGRMKVATVDVSSGEKHKDIELNVGDATKVAVGTAHRPYNPFSTRCRFLIIQGFGHKDFLPFEPKKP